MNVINYFLGRVNTIYCFQHADKTAKPFVAPKPVAVTLKSVLGASNVTDSNVTEIRSEAEKV